MKHIGMLLLLVMLSGCRDGKLNSSTRSSTTTAKSSVDEIINQFTPANIAFNVPKQMSAKETKTITLLLSMDNTIDELKSAIFDEGKKKGMEILIHDQMEARLTGQNFEIAAITKETQAVASRGITVWKWDIKSTHEGVQKLHLTLSAVFKINGESQTRTIRTFDEVIEIVITPMDRVKNFVSNNWQWLWTVLIPPLAYVINRIWKKKKTENT